MGLRARPKPRRQEARQHERESEPQGLASRRLATTLLLRVLRDRALLDDVLTEPSATAQDLSERDRAFARAIATASLRHLGTIRHGLKRFLHKDLPSGARLVEMILVSGAAQILFLDSPDHAAVDAAVALAKANPASSPFAGLVNAILRKVAAEKDEILAQPGALDTPDWLLSRWTASYGEETALLIAAAHRREPALDITVKADPELWAARLDAILLPTGSLRLRGHAPVAELDGYGEGAWWVQDAAAALPARLLRPGHGERVLDLCAAPGGKTAQLTSAGAQVTALDRSAHRLERLAANMARLGLAVETIAADALSFDSSEPFDGVLLDAPCSATGTIRRHPDVAWIKRSEDIAALAATQAKLLAKAATLVRPGGRLVYCTCSLEPEEGEDQIAAFLAANPAFAREPITAADIGGLAEAVTPAGDLRTLPSMLPHEEPRLAGLDGFFAARLVRQG